MSNGPTVEDPNSPVGQISGTQQGLAQFAGPYVTEMLGKGMALADKPFEAYTGPLTAGASGLQEQAFAEYAGLDPNQQTGIGSFSTGYTPGSFTTASAQQFMNPYLQAALEPQLREARRQADISRVADAGRLTRAGAFGGSRQAIMEAEGARNLGQQLADITGRGYSDAFTQAQRQFNVEQEALRRAEEASRAQFNEEERRRIAAEEADRRFGLDALGRLERAGEKQREIEQEGITADYLQFQQEQQYPYEQLQFMQSLLQGLPITATSRQFVEPGGFQQISGGLAGLLALLGGRT